MVLVIVSSLLAAYGTSYARMSRGGMREAELYGLDGFLYVPCETAATTENLTWHSLIGLFYAPANRIDQVLFGGPAPVRVSCMMQLSG